MIEKNTRQHDRRLPTTLTISEARLSTTLTLSEAILSTALTFSEAVLPATLTFSEAKRKRRFVFGLSALWRMAFIRLPTSGGAATWLMGIYSLLEVKCRPCP